MERVTGTALRCMGGVRAFATTVNVMMPPKAAAASGSSAASSSTPAPAPTRAPRTRADPFASSYDMKNLELYKFDDATSLGWLRLEKIREAQVLFEKVDVDRVALRAQARKFTPPPQSSSIRLRSTIDLSNPTSPKHSKSVLVVPVSSLPLTDSTSVQRLKLLAGPRWSPGYPGKAELGELDPTKQDAEGIEGWLKIAEERFQDPRTNRRSVGDILERLVEAAKDPDSPLPADTPLDHRHLLARQAKKKHRSVAHTWARAQALEKRKEVVGGVKGFPIEWLDTKVDDKTASP